MNPDTLQDLLDELLATSRQQWRLRLFCVIAATGTLLAAAAGAERWWPFGLVLVPTLAAVSAVRPDSHTPLLFVVIVVWHWLATIDDPTTPWLPVAAVCLLAFHTTIAATATLPSGGVLPAVLLTRWAMRLAIVSSATVFLWVAVVVMERREAPGNGLLTAAALAIVAGAAAFIRSNSLDRS